jgi:hypothetical protein
MMKRLITLSSLLLGLSLSAFAQQSKLPPCPKPDYSKSTDRERFAKWSNCFGRYKVELDATYKGDVLEGEWLNGYLHGQGTYYFLANNQFKGDKYVGECKDGKANGQGTYTFANGDKYVGEFKDDKYNGQGIGTTADGRRFEGIWENGKFIREARVSQPER